jgi:indolepyruvate ferredoxin oxidoreductase beta subunit
LVTVLKELNIVVAGVGGQGSILLSHIIGNAAIREGYKVRVAETYGASMRGGAVLGQIRIGQSVLGPLIAEDSAHILVGLEPIESLRVAVKYLSPQGIAIVNTRPLMPMSVSIGKAVYPSLEKIVTSLKKLGKKVMPIDASGLAEKAGSPRTLNIVMLGALAATGKLPISSRTLKKIVEEHVPKGTEQMNLRAYELGYKAILKLRT